MLLVSAKVGGTVMVLSTTMVADDDAEDDDEDGATGKLGNEALSIEYEPSE